MPKGWQICNLGDISYRHIDKVKKPDDWANLPLIDLGRLNSKQLFNENYGIGSELNTSVTRFEKGDLLFGAIRPYFHKVSLSQVDGVTNVSVFVIRPKEEISYAFLVNLLYLDKTVDFAVRLSKGTKMPVISWPDLSSLRVILPPKLIMESFNEKITPLIEKGLENAASIKILADIRDTLLPKLISGQLSLSAGQKESGF
jgi:type I restriction enzyme S subunit